MLSPIEWYRFYELGGSCVPPWGGTLMSVSSLANTDTTWSNSLEMVVCSPWPGKMFECIHDLPCVNQIFHPKDLDGSIFYHRDLLFVNVK